MDRLELLLEAERRGILPSEQVELLNEARSRGMVNGSPQAQASAAPEPSFADQLKRQGGLAVRQTAEGLAGVPGLFISPFQKLAGVKTMNEGVTSILDRMGLPKEETPGEHIAGAVSRGIAGGGGMAKAASAIPAALGAGSAWVNNLFAQQPVLQALQSGVGAGASEAVKQGGGGEGAQLIAGAVAPLGVSGGSAAVQAAGRGARELVRPVTQRGADQIAADVVGRITQDRTGALRNLDDYVAANRAQATGGPQVGVPGSRPTAGAVSADYGIVGAEQLAARGPSNPLFAARYAENNQARLDELSKLRATQDVYDKYVSRREELTSKARDAAFNNTRSDVEYVPVAEKIRDIAKTPEGGRVESEKALEWLANRVMKYVNEGRIDPRNAYELHKDIGDLVAGKVKDSNGSALRLAGGLANDVKKTLATQIESAAPGFKNYLEAYNRLSKPIDRLEVMIEKLGGEGLTKVTNSGISAGPQGPAFTLSQGGIRKKVDALDAALPAGPNGLKLAPYQRDVLGRVSGDLNAEAFARRSGKEPGSDTYQNMATANFLRGVLGDSLAESGIARTISSPLNFAMRPLEGRVNDIVTRAFLDPEEMARLLRLARTRRPSPTLLGTTEAAGSGLGFGLLGGALAP